MLNGILHHLLFTLRLNFRSKQALVYGYLVPIFFLFAFGTLFHGEQSMGQLLTISVLGGACFGMPTSMVAERERGVWRRYRLLPTATGNLVVSTMIARYFIVASAAVMQILLAKWIYKTEFPRHPFQLFVAFSFVAFAFEAMGLVIAAAADNVPAVQALGQAIFLPVIIIGGVGVPLSTLPGWAQKVAGFFPGRYAVEAMEPCFTHYSGLNDAGFDLLALTVIGIAGCVAGAKLFRWDANQHIRLASRGWVLLAVASWIAIGLSAFKTGHLKPVRHAVSTTSHGETHPWDKITDEQSNSFNFAKLSRDSDVTMAPLAPNATGVDDPVAEKRMEMIVQKLETWPLGRTADDGQNVRNLLSAAAIADVSQDSMEGQIARAVFDRLREAYPPDQLVRLLTWVAIAPDQGTVITDAPELDIHGPVPEDMIRRRDLIYALKLLGRLLGKLPDVQEDPN
jgi:ABC-2 type transport system permease protein